MLDRRQFMMSAAFAAAPAKGKALTPKERVNRMLAGQAPDRAPFTYWHHFGLEKEPATKFVTATLEFQKKFHTDIVKVMSDYPYPKGGGKSWWELKVEQTPFPEQLKALAMIRDGLAGQKFFLETIFNPWNVAEKLSSKDDVLRLKAEKPQALLDALEVIAKSEANHAREAVKLGASGIFLAIANNDSLVMSEPEYKKYSEPFDRMILDAVKDAPMNTLHLHGERIDFGVFWKGWSAPIINYSVHGTMFSLTRARKAFDGVLMGGLDERTVRNARPEEIQAMIDEAKVVGPKWICAPGCSVPDESKDEELLRVTKACEG